MAEPVKGGVVDIAAVIEQVTAVQDSMVAIVDAILSSGGGGMLLNIKAKMAKLRLEASGRQLVGLLTKIGDVIDSVVEKLEDSDSAEKINEGMKKLISDPANISNLMQAAKKGNTSAVFKDMGDNAGLLEKTIALFVAVNLFGELKTPNPITMMFKMLMLNLSTKILVKGIGYFLNSAQKMQEAIEAANIDIKSWKKLDKLLKLIQDISKTMIKLTLITLAAAMVAPIVAFAVKMLSKSLGKIAHAISMMVGSGVLQKAILNAQKLNVLLRTLHRSFQLITRTVWAVLWAIMSIALVGSLAVFLMLPAIMGMAVIAIVVGVLTMYMMMIARQAPFAAAAGHVAMAGLRPTIFVILGIALLLLTLALIEPAIEGSYAEILKMLLCIALVILGMVAFIALVGLLAPVLTLGSAVMVVVLIAVLCIIGIVLLLLLINWVAQYIDLEEMKASIDKVMKAVETLIQAIFEADMIDPTPPKDTGLIGAIAHFIGGDLLESFVMLAMKVAILYVTMFAAAVILAIEGLLILIVKLYNSHKTEIDSAPEIINVVVDACAAAVQSVLNAEMNTKVGEEDGLFLQLVDYVFGPDVASIFKLLCRVVIVLLTMITLAMVKFLIDEMIWITNVYKEHKNDVDGLPAVIETIVTVAFKCVNTVIITGDGTDFGETKQGIFGVLIEWIFGEDVYKIFHLLFKVLIIALSMIVLAMVKFIIGQMVDILHYYQENQSSISQLPGIAKTIVQVAFEVIETILNGSATMNDKGKPTFLKVLAFIFGDDITTILELFLKVVLVGMAMIALAMIASLVKYMKEIYDDYKSLGGENLGKNVVKMTKMIIKAAYDVIAEISKSQEEAKPKRNSKLAALLDWLGFDTLATITDMLTAFVTIALAITGLSVLLSLAKIMGDCWDIYQKMGGANISSNAIKMTNGLINGAQQIIDTLKQSKIDFGDADRGNLGFWAKRALDVLESYVGSGLTGMIDLVSQNENLFGMVAIVTSICGSANVLQYTMKMIEQSTSALGQIRNDTSRMIEAVESVSGEIMSMDPVDNSGIDAKLQTIEDFVYTISTHFNRLLGDPSVSLMGKLVDNVAAFSSVVFSNGAFINQINSLDLAKAQSLAEIFGNAAAFSNSLNGQVGELARAISEFTRESIDRLTQAVIEADQHMLEVCDRFAVTARQACDAMTTATANMKSAMKTAVIGLEKEINKIFVKVEEKFKELQKTISEMQAGGGGVPINDNSSKMKSIFDEAKKIKVGDTETYTDDDYVTTINGLPAIRVYAISGETGHVY